MSISAKKSMQQVTTIRLPKHLYEQVRSAVESGGTEASSLNDFILAAIRTYLAAYRRRQIDAAFQGMAKDPGYQQEMKLMAEEFAQSDWEALRLTENDLNT